MATKKKTTKRKPARRNVQVGTAAMSLQDIGDRYGVSFQTIQQIEQKALRKIRHAIEQEAKRAGCTPLKWLFGDE
jgi:DNA-directed RNA polymerase sigma subunit (sigma70/sigma32)